MQKIIILVATIFLIVSTSFAAEVTLTWDPSTGIVSGYKIHYGTQSGQYSTTVTVGNVLEYTIKNLSAGTTYYFAVTAYNSAGESGFSNEIKWTAPDVPSDPSPQIQTFIVSPSEVNNPKEPITFSVQATSPVGEALTYLIDFGDGSSLNKASAKHTYTEAGTYNVKVTVTDSSSRQATATKTVIVRDQPPAKTPGLSPK